MKKKHRNYDNDFPSVTQIIDIMRKPGLEYWFKNNTPEFIRKESKKAKEIGGQLHEAIQSHIELNELKVDTQYPNEITNALKSFILFKQEYPSIQLKRSEIKMTSDKLKFNGTMDCLGADTEGEVIFDWKSSKAKDDIRPAIYDEYLIQVAAYVNLYNETHQAEIKRAYILSLAKDKIAYNFLPVTTGMIETGFQIFLNCLDIYNNKKMLIQLRKEQ